MRHSGRERRVTQNRARFVDVRSGVPGKAPDATAWRSAWAICSSLYRDRFMVLAPVSEEL
jgi:hypothetical protein